MTCSVHGCKMDMAALALIISADGTLSEFVFCKDHTSRLPMDYLIPDAERLRTVTLGDSYEDCFLHAVFLEYEQDRFTVVLRGKETGAVFVIQTGYIEATLIRGYARKIPYTNPLTHELILDVMNQIGGVVSEAVVNVYDAKDDSYRCYLAIETAGELVKVKCRISDAVCISLCAGVPVRIDRAFLGKDLTSSEL